MQFSFLSRILIRVREGLTSRQRYSQCILQLRLTSVHLLLLLLLLFSLLIVFWRNWWDLKYWLDTPVYLVTIVYITWMTNDSYVLILWSIIFPARINNRENRRKKKKKFWLCNWWKLFFSTVTLQANVRKWNENQISLKQTNFFRCGDDVLKIAPFDWFHCQRMHKDIPTVVTTMQGTVISSPQ